MSVNRASEIQTATTPASKRTVVAWSLWDWGSASFNAVVTTFVFGVYITSSAFGPEEETSSKLSFTLMIAGLIVAITAPVVSQTTDLGGRRKQWLGINTAIVIACTALLVFVAPAPRLPRARTRAARDRKYRLRVCERELQLDAQANLDKPKRRQNLGLRLGHGLHRRDRAARGAPHRVHLSRAGLVRRLS